MATFGSAEGAQMYTNGLSRLPATLGLEKGLAAEGAPPGFWRHLFAVVMGAAVMSVGLALTFTLIDLANAVADFSVGRNAFVIVTYPILMLGMAVFMMLGPIGVAFAVASTALYMPTRKLERSDRDRVILFAALLLACLVAWLASTAKVGEGVIGDFDLYRKPMHALGAFLATLGGFGAYIATLSRKPGR